MIRLLTCCLLTGLGLALLCGCALNYPQRPDADLFIPILAGPTEDAGEDDRDPTQPPRLYRISKALEQEYFANWLQDVELKSCSGKGRQASDSVPLVQITKVLQPMDWEALESNQHPFEEGIPGGVLFGHAVKVQDATLLSLRFVLSPLESVSYRWCSRTGAPCVDLPYRYLRLEEVSMSDKAIALFDDEAGAKIYAGPTGEEFLRYLDDGESVILDVESIGAIGRNEKLPDRLPIRATQKFSLELTEGSTNVPIRYDLPVEQNGYINLVNLSFFTDESAVYMSIVRSMILAQAGQCDAAYSVYHKIESQLDRETRAQMLIIIAHLHGQSGGRVDAVLKCLAEVVSEHDEKYVETYRLLNEENPMPPAVSRAKDM